MDENDPRIADLGFARVDLDRAARTGDPEVVYGAGKTPDQVVAILRALHERHPEDAGLRNALEELAFFTTDVKILGVYPADGFRG